MSTKALLKTIGLSGFLLFTAAGVCFADASFQLEETAVYKNRYGNQTFSDYYNVAAVAPDSVVVMTLAKMIVQVENVVMMATA